MAFSWRAAAAALILIAGSSQASAQASSKLGVVNGRQLLQDAPGRAEAQALLKTETDYFDAELGRMTDSLNAMQTKYLTDEATLSPAARTSRQKEIKDKLALFQAKSDSIRGIAERRQADLLQPVIDLVNRQLQAVREEEGYAIIFDLSADGQPIVAYDKNLDVTDKVLAKVKVQAKPKLPPTIIKQGAVVKPPRGSGRPR